jgi:hypothetical protein
VYACIQESLTSNAQTNLLIEVERERFTVHGYLDILFLLKVLLSKTQKDTIATDKMI